MANKEFQLSIWIWLVVSILSYLSSATEIEIANDLKVFHGTKDVTGDVFVSGTKACLPSFNETDLPRNITGLSVEAPSALSNTMFSSEYKNVFYPGATIKWKSPKAGASHLHIKGFFVNITGKISGTRCRLYLINHKDFMENILDFSFTLPYFTDMVDNFIITVYSLPLNNHHAEMPSNRLSRFITTPAPTNSASPGHWAPSVSFNTSLKNGTIDVVFNLPPKVEGWSLTHFKVILLKWACSPLNSYDTIDIIKEKDTNDIEEHVQFKGLNDDLYKVKVEVVNHGFGNSSLCICKRLDDCSDCKSSYCSINCESTQSYWFDLKGDEYPDGNSSSPKQVSCEPPGPETTPSTENTSQGATLTDSTQDLPSTGNVNDGLNQGEIVGIVVGVVFGVILIIIFIIIIIIYYRHSQKPPDIDNSKQGQKKGTVMQVSNIKRKTVYIVAASDHPESKQLIQSFCELLKTHCHCDVINPSDAYSNQKSENIWVAKEIGRSDSVIIVNSKGAEKLIDAKLSEQTDVILDFNHSMFMKALQIAFNSSTKKFLIVSFSNDLISDKLAIFEPKKFFLPKQMSSFLCTIHNLSENEAEKFKGQLPFDEGCLPNIQGGQDFIKAISDVEHFEKKKAKWFDENYNLTNSIMGTTNISYVGKQGSTSSSESSGCSSSGHGPLSVSMTDLSSMADSPTPTFTEAPASPDDGIWLDDITFPQEGSSEILSAYTDFRSYATVGKSSDGPCSVVDDPTVNQTNTSSASRHLQINPPQSSDCSKGIVPPRVNISTDDASNIMANNNDTLSMWSKQTDCRIIYENENDNDFNNVPSEQPPGRLPKVKPPLKFSPTDNISARLRASNEENDEVTPQILNPKSLQLEDHVDSGMEELSV